MDPAAHAETAIPHVADATRDVEFATYRPGCAAAPGLADEVREEVRLALRDRLAALWPQRRVEVARPEVTVIVHAGTPPRVELDVAPIFVAGRYCKLVRGLTQTVLHCRWCRGRRGGCNSCGGTGRLVAEAVDDFVRPPIELRGRGELSCFHGAGREDVDVRMLGAGRPFVVSVMSPRRRTFPLDDVPSEVEAASGGRVTVAGLAFVGRESMRRLTTEHGTKTYRAVVRPAPGASLPADAASRLAALSGAEVRQRTPARVEARRADLVRPRRVHAVEIEEAGADALVVRITTDPGTYVKELVSGDGGRTEPSFASLLGQPCVCAELDVLAAGTTA